MSDLPARLRASDGFRVFTAGDGGRAFAADTGLMVEAADRIEQLEAELEATRQSWVNGEAPGCQEVGMVACKGPCGVSDEVRP